MAWNDPGSKNNNGQDPWGKKNGPPDLDEAIRQVQRKIASLFGGGKSKGFDINPNGARRFLGAGSIASIVGVIYLLSGIYIVQPYELAVIKRFGEYVGIEQPGPHWIPRIIESATIVNVDEVKTTQHGGQMLTKDENIVSAEIAVQYRIADPEAYLFNLVDPELTIKQVSDSALRSIVGQSTLSEVLTTGRTEIASKIRKQIETVLNNYNSGVQISDLAMQQTKAPDEVKEAFDDAIKAQQDEERFVNEAEVYANQNIPVAQGQANRMTQEAQAYKEQQVLKAKGSTARFDKLLPEYRRQPQVMRDRLYMDAMEDVLSKTNKVIVDGNVGNNMMVLPLDQLKSKKATKELGQPINISTPSNKVVKATQESQGKTDNRIRPLYEDINNYEASKGE